MYSGQYTVIHKIAVIKWAKTVILSTKHHFTTVAIVLGHKMYSTGRNAIIFINIYFFVGMKLLQYRRESLGRI